MTDPTPSPDAAGRPAAVPSPEPELTSASEQVTLSRFERVRRRVNNFWFTFLGPAQRGGAVHPSPPSRLPAGYRERVYTDSSGVEHRTIVRDDTAG